MCNVMESGSKTMKECKFPFIFKGQTFESCTDYKDPDGKLWCSTLLDAEGKHVGGKGYWGYCENFQYCSSNKRGKLNNEVQDFLKEELGILGYCSQDGYSTEKVENYMGRGECPCKPISECAWAHQLQTKADKLPARNKIRKNVVQLIRDSICDYSTRTIHCCDQEGDQKDVPRKIRIPKKKEDSGIWKPDPKKGECGEDLKTQFIVCDDEDGCLATRNEFPYMALLGYDVLNNGKIFYTCGASVINKKYVLTAAHCHNEKKYVERIREVVVGEYVVGEDPDCERGRCSPPIQKFGVEKVINHENWDASRKGFLKGNDIALVRLDGYITLFLDDTLGSAVVPVCLPWSSNNPRMGNIEPGSDLVITGWGRITNNNHGTKKAYLEHSVATRTLR